ncbi:NrtR DNA-binding winged helix domain-containing protein [Trichocoleus sp. FACHB-262]|uniref:NrtR DNA-binding winged helix domain-containing protein n=1 Tax=Trichocoleus sp. FACHB-262 TaxID=2692869 RepID=UPI00168808BF|nr:hypothetical protein [Trichocoleus sp. FACHB-262]MBD2119336.1 hypothetical protein [Trichocoleus sp. FACHB-262]
MSFSAVSAEQSPQGQVRYEPIGFELLPSKFTLSQLKILYETVLGVSLDKGKFRKEILKKDLLIELDKTQIDESKYPQLKEKGFNFEI